MGGHAFSGGPKPLVTPRMSRDIYRQVKDRCHSILRSVFLYVASPIEGPGKEDYGDIDILVALEKRLIFPKAPGDQADRPVRDVLSEIQTVLGATAIILEPGGTSANLALPWPADVPGSHFERPAREPWYIQVDIRLCKDIEDVQWRLFNQAHGDIWNLLGSTIRPFGLTVDDQALWLRIPEIEELDRKRAKVLLARDPAEILRFLGLEIDGFWEEPFSSIQDLFNYVSSCRLFWIRPPQEKLDGEDGKIWSDVQSLGVQGGDTGRKQLKSNDRKRMKSRPVFRRWIDEFIPRCQEEGRGIVLEPAMTVERMRDTVRAEAFDFFRIEPEYNDRATAWRLERQQDYVWKTVIKGSVRDGLDPSFRGCLTNALKKVIMQDDTSFGFTPSMPLRDKVGFYDIGKTTEFIAEIQEALGPVAWARQQERAREIHKQKELKKKQLR